MSYKFNKGNFKSTDGFTLSEVLIASAVSLVALAILTTLLIVSLKFYYYGGDKLMANRDLRIFTDQLARAGSNASYFRIYPSLDDMKSKVLLGDSGDVVTFFYLDPTDTSETKLSRVISYFQEPTATDGKTPIRCFEWSGPGANFDSKVMLPNVTNLPNYKIIAENVLDISNNTKLFTNFEDKSIVVKANIFYKGTLRPAVSNTYNFTITPRG